MIDRTLRIGDLIEVPPVQTVIRLEEGRTRSEAISKSFVFTEEVASHFAVLSDALLKDHGRGFFLQGDFGSGKSHFLAALSAWLSENQGSEVLSQTHSGLRRARAAGRKILPVDVSLVNFRSTTALEKVLVEAIEAALLAHGIETQLTPRSAFLTHFKTLLKTGKLAGLFAEQLNLSPDEIGTFLSDHPRRSYIEGVRFMKEQGLNAPETLVEDRFETFEKSIKSVHRAGFDGLMLIIDELSEFFRSKPDARGLNEDARTLQLLGELADTEPLWIIAAVQESIEKTGDISQATFRKIKDRFPIKLILSSLHIKALISRRLVQHKSGADAELYTIYEYLRGQFPSISWSFEDFRATYPVHPTTIELLDGLGNLFSEHRGVVDFVYSQVAGDESRQITGILGQPCYVLLGPDSIYDHFSQRLAEFSTFHGYIRHIVPHLDDVIARTIEEDDDRELARRIVRILVLFGIHPAVRVPAVRELTELSSCALSDQDPDLNVQFVAETILDVLVAESKFLAKHPSDTGDPLQTVYTIVTQEDPSKTIKARIARRASELPPDDNRLLLEPLADLPESPSWPGTGLMQRGIYRIVPWRQSNRKAIVCFLNSEEEDALTVRISAALSSVESDFAMVISLGKTNFRLEHTAVWEIALPPEEKDAAVLSEYLATTQITSELKPSNPADAALLQSGKEAEQRLKPAAQQTALGIFYGGYFANKHIPVEPVIRDLRRFDRLLELAAGVLLEDRYPGYREIAPRKVTPTRLLYQRLVDEFVSPGSLSLRQAHSRGLNDAIEGLATPLGLVELRSGSYIFAPDPENHPLLSTVFNLLNPAGHTRLDDVLHSLRTGRFGLPTDTAHFLLSALAYGGLITLLANGRAIPLEFLRLTGVEKADALAPGDVIGKHDRETLMRECNFLGPDAGWESFGLRQQREAWQAAIKFRDSTQKIVADIDKHLAALAEFSAFKSFDLDGLRVQLEKLKHLTDEIKISYPAREGLERFLKAWRQTGLSAQDIDVTKKMRAFFSRQAEQFIFVNHYLRHQAVDQAASQENEIATLQNTVIQWLDQPDVLVQDEDPTRLMDAFDRFRQAYARFYSQAHTGHYSLFEKKPLSKIAARAFKLLQRLASIDILDRPAGINNLFRELAGPRNAVCKRNLSEELLRSPLCSCGFIPGRTPQPFHIADPDSTIEKFLADYLQILKDAAVREAISARIFALTDANPDTAGRLRSLLNLLEDEKISSAALLDVLDDVTAGEISKALSGKVQIERRKLKDLVTHLAGRRLAPNQVFEAVKEWVAVPNENTVIALEDEGTMLTQNRVSPHTWWSTMHREIFKEDARPAIRDIEDALEHQYPSAMLRDKLAYLDDLNLTRFLADEPFHTSAIRAAWVLLAERILADAPWPQQAAIYSRHVDRENAGQIKKRLNVMKRIWVLKDAGFPEPLRARIPLSEILADHWASADLRSLTRQRIETIAKRGDEWLTTLPAMAPIDLTQNPVVVIIDGVSPDVWLDTMDDLKSDIGDLKLSWHRLDVPPKTALSVASLFGFRGDALDEFHARDIEYHQVKGNEVHELSDILPAFETDRPAVIRVALVDEAAHAALMRIAEMPRSIGRFLKKELARLQKICADQNRPLILTTDHGLTLTRSGLTHGQGGVYERAIFRAQW